MVMIIAKLDHMRLCGRLSQQEQGSQQDDERLYERQSWHVALFSHGLKTVK